MGTLRLSPVRSESGSLFRSLAIWDDGNCCARVSMVRSVSSDVTRKMEIAFFSLHIAQWQNLWCLMWSSLKHLRTLVSLLRFLENFRINFAVLHSSQMITTGTSMHWTIWMYSLKSQICIEGIMCQVFDSDPRSRALTESQKYMMLVPVMKILLSTNKKQK